MKKVIDRKRYDTEKAELIGEYSFSNPSDFNYVSEGLYVTKSGNYFLAGEGGAMSKYRETVDQNTWSGGEDIIPMSKEEALEWAEQNLSADDIEKYFPDDIDDA